jgi:uncharacterized damage-inducible protein DinB
MTLRMPTGRPLPGEFASEVAADIDAVPGEDAIAALEDATLRTLGLLEPLAGASVDGLTYAPGKWTLKEVVGHLADDERIFAYRALCLARGDSRELPGFDENRYNAVAGFEQRSLASLLAEYRSVRQATLSLLSGLPADAWLRRGTVNGYSATVRGLAFHIAGHELHHLRMLRERYVPRLG